MFYINQSGTPSFPIGLVKTKSDFMVRSVETGLEVATKKLLHQQVKIPG